MTLLRFQHQTLDNILELLNPPAVKGVPEIRVQEQVPPQISRMTEEEEYELAELMEEG